MTFKHNVGSFDAAFRFVSGAIIIGAGHHFGSWWGLIGLLPMISAGLAFCPLYAAMHFDTCAQDEREQP